jgi:tetratricopeptide (TPR) repeat protein
VALALRSDSPGVHLNLGRALKDKGDVEGAIRRYRSALRIDPNYALAHYNLGAALKARGKVEEAIACFRRAIALDPKLAMAHNNLGIALSGKGQVDEAIACFRKAIEIDPKYANAHNGLGVALHDKGKEDEAIACFHRAIALDPKLAKAHDNLGAALAGKGRVDEAIAEHRQAIHLDPKYAAAHYNLGTALHAKGKVDEAIAEFRQAIRLQPDLASAHNNLGNALDDKGKVDEAIAAYRQAIRLKKDYAKAHCNLGHTLVRQGHFREAVEAFRRGHQLGIRRSDWRYPSRLWLRQAESLARLDDRLSAVLAGQDSPKDAAELLGFAQLCQNYRHRYAVAARFYAEAFAAQPALVTNLQAGQRYNAACAAALAGCGKGDQGHWLPAQQRIVWRQQALAWLRADLDAWRRLLDGQPQKVSPVLVKQMQHWQRDTDFAGLRDRQALAQLPDAERPAWQQLWADMADTLARAQVNASPGKKPDLK